jgi:uncharacterized UPF0160 family protein
MSGKGSFDTKAPLCEAWRGLRGPELEKVSGIEKIEFAHHSGFIGGAWTLEAVIKMAELSLEELKRK